MKKILSLMLLCMLFVVSCGKEKKESKEVNVYTWTYFIPDEVIEDFEKETGIKVNLSYYDNNDTMIAKLMSGTSQYDVITPSTDFVEVMIKSDLIEKLDKEKLPETFKNLDVERFNLEEVSKIYDEGLNYSIPYGFFATGITVNKKVLGENFDRTPKIFNDDKYKGKMTLLDDGREVIGMALQYLGYSSDTKDMKELNEAKEMILEWKKNIVKFDSNVFGKGLLSGEFYISHSYPDVYYEAEGDEINDFEYFLPKGAMMYIDSMAITKKGENKENAYKFLEFLYKPENYSKVFEEYRMPSVIKGVEENSEVKAILSAEEIVSKSTLPKGLDDETKEIQDKIWNEIKIGQ